MTTYKVQADKVWSAYYDDLAHDPALLTAIKFVSYETIIKRKVAFWATSGPLTHYQKARGIDTSKRKRIE